MTKRIRRDNVKKNEVKTEKTYIEGVRINFLYVDKYSFGGEWYMPESKIPYSMLRYITAGKAIFIIDGKEITVEKNQVVYIPRGCELSCHALGSTFSFMSIKSQLLRLHSTGKMYSVRNQLLLVMKIVMKWLELVTKIE